MALLKPFDIRERTFEFAVRIVQLSSTLPETTELRVVRTQLVRSGTSIGANVEEADGGGTRPEKRRGFTIARKEAREACYWLRILDRVMSKRIALESDIREANELVLILSAIISKLG